MNDMEAGVLIFIVILAVGLSVIVTAIADRSLNKYEDTIAEYMMCIKYNTDDDCSDIILSEYGNEAE